MKLLELKIKRLTFAAEAKIIKAEEHKALNEGRKRRAGNRPFDLSYAQYNTLRDHRRKVLRPVARINHLAHAYLKGMPYAKVENPLNTKITSPATELIKVIRAFGDLIEVDLKPKDIHRWIEGGPTLFQHLEALKSAAEATVAENEPEQTAAAE